MLVHSNPMRRTGPGQWIDTNLNRVRVRPILVNSGAGAKRDRWLVEETTRKGSSWSFVSRHITEEQAVVDAQTLANRLFKPQKKRRRIAKVTALDIDKNIQQEMLRELSLAISESHLADRARAAQERALRLVETIQKAFHITPR